MKVKNCFVLCCVCAHHRGHRNEKQVSQQELDITQLHAN